MEFPVEKKQTSAKSGNCRCTNSDMQLAADDMHLLANFVLPVIAINYVLSL